MNPKPEYIYIAFDVFPSQKGAATHIDHCLKALQNTFNTGLLICLGNDGMPSFQFDNQRNLYVYRWKEKVVNFLERTQKFQEAVTKVLNLPLCKNVQLIHFRDIWGGFPVLNHTKTYKTVFEVNAFQHIELPNRYPNISTSVLEKIKTLEHLCITRCDTIITPSKVTQLFIEQYANTSNKVIHVIPNGVTIYEAKPLGNKTANHSPFILYFGALQKWQGIKTLFKAFNELLDLDLRLRICTSIPEKRTQDYKILANSIGIGHRVDWFYEQDKPTLASHIKAAKLTVAPLTACNRNIIQGCNPLKIVESMAYAVPVVASNIPVVREIIEDNITGLLVTPDRPEALGRKIRAVIEQTETLNRIGLSAKLKVEKNYLWLYQEAKMNTIYQNLLSND
ncbi:glycosyltransferase family 4 protein [Olleya namhaensis]|uniref:Glycosyltransferase involved in cell wall bisynthesis n=1 Tax=Olleya namhaensis TaxID=1144750 RepID=A0A1I3R0L3_9FLAO|nr:glycosyltransferase family 4 protein [Olleya namhaensis]SFJ40024.1 Glycosyltransferase involved in cell wall bisynthesis [Olleya namhaensis]